MKLKARKKKTVTFAPVVTAIVQSQSVRKSSPITDEERNTLWYNHAELTRFRNERDRQDRAGSRKRLRDMTPRHTRLLYRHKARMVVLNCQRDLKTVNKRLHEKCHALAQSSSRYSMWANYIALVDAKWNFFEAYGPYMNGSLSSPAMNSPRPFTTVTPNLPYNSVHKNIYKGCASYASPGILNYQDGIPI